MTFTPDTEHKIGKVEGFLVGMNGVSVDEGTMLLFLAETRAYPALGYAFAITSGILSLEKYVGRFVLPNDPEYQTIKGSFHHSDSHEDFKHRQQLLDKRSTGVMEQYVEKKEEFPDGIIVALYEQIIILSAFQLEQISEVDESPKIVDEPIDPRKVGPTKRKY
jgi:hypothetical protein